MTYRHVPPPYTQTEFNLLLDDFTGWKNGFTPSGTYATPYAFVISKNGSDYYASNAYQTIYGGSSDAGGVDGSDFAAVYNTALTNGNIYIKDGVYNPTSTLNFVSGHWTKGESQAGVLIKVPDACADGFTKPNASENCLFLWKEDVPGYDFGLYDVTIDTNPLETPLIDELDPICLFSEHFRATIQNCFIKGYDGTDIAGIFDRYGREDRIIYNHIENGGVNGGLSAEAIYTYLTNTSLFAYNYIDTMSREGFYIAEGTGLDVSGDNKFIGNTVLHCGAEAFDIRSARNILEANHVHGCTNGFWLSAPENQVKNNVIQGGIYGVALDTGDVSGYGCLISGNKIDNATTAIGLNNSEIKYCIISDNYIRDGGTGVLLDAAILNNVVNNVFKSNTQGVYLKNVAGRNNIIGVMSYGNAYAVMDDDSTNYNTISGVSGTATVQMIYTALAEASYTNRIVHSYNPNWVEKWGTGT